MSGVVFNSINSYSAGDAALPADVIHPNELDIVVGTLSNIIEPDDQDFLLARIAGQMVELPKSLSASLWALMGQKVIVGLLLGKHRAEMSTQ